MIQDSCSAGVRTLIGTLIVMWQRVSAFTKESTVFVTYSSKILISEIVINKQKLLMKLAKDLLRKHHTTVLHQHCQQTLNHTAPVGGANEAWLHLCTVQK